MPSPVKLAHGAAMLLDCLAQQLGDPLHQLVRGFFSRSFGKGGKSNEIRK